MKLKTLVLASATAIFALGYTSCKKSDSTAADTSAATTVQATADQSASDNTSDDAQTAMTESINAVNPGISGDGVANHNNINPQTATCATISVDSSQGWPRTVTITFTNCPSLYGWFTRNGTLTVVLSGPIRNPGSTATITFGSNYTVTVHNGNVYQLQGTHIWTNVSDVPGVSRTWTRQVLSGSKVTNVSTGHWWLHSGTRTVTQTFINGTVPASFVVAAGANHVVTNEFGISHYDTVLTSLTRYYSECPWIHSGTIKFAGPRHSAVLDFGYNPTGSLYCDADATYSIDGGAAIPFTLR